MSSTVGQIEKQTQARVVDLQARRDKTRALKLGMMQPLLNGRIWRVDSNGVVV